MALTEKQADRISWAVVILVAVAMFSAVIAGSIAAKRQIDEWDRINDRADLLYCSELAERHAGVWCTNGDGSIITDEDN